MKYVINSKKDDAIVAHIDQFPYGCGYQPETSFSIWYEAECGFHLEMKCMEQNPKAQYKNHNDPVYKDSCMEFFVNFYPTDKKTGYLNFEMNANGAMLLYYGENRDKRRSVHELLLKKHTVNITEQYWQINLLVPLEFIKKIYGKCEFQSGDMIKVNAYKCGDDTKVPHYGCWNKVLAESPDFHRPEFFGDMVIV
ncbi:carbohydrate-binding family 9-like protein [Clostridium sediminicola]|uniref:carbohydrate-binding family 9-like protein n=1 Tax=Clostridium sediminicola TaxID=3114879 RepID=UPI0031F21E86